MPLPPDPSSPTPPPDNRRNKNGKSPKSRPRQESALRRTVIRPASIPVDPIDGAFVSDRMTTLTHELANLLDGSMRCLSLARRGVENTPPGGPPATAKSVSHQLEVVHSAMQQMAELVKCAMQGLPFSQSRGEPGLSGSFADAARQAIDVMSPVAEERGIRLSGEIDDQLEELQGRFAFAILTNVIRNAIESIERSGRHDGCIEVQARLEPGKTGRGVLIEVLDNGEGPPELPSRGGESVFRLGFTTKPGGKGVGLAFCRELVQELGGTISLTGRDEGKNSKKDGRGAAFRALIPLGASQRTKEEPLQS